MLLHAFPLNARMWEPQLGLSEQGRRVIAPHCVALTAERAIRRPPPSTTTPVTSSICSTRCTSMMPSRRPVDGRIRRVCAAAARAALRSRADSRRHQIAGRHAGGRRRPEAHAALVAGRVRPAVVRGDAARSFSASHSSEPAGARDRVRSIAPSNPPRRSRAASRADVAPDSTPLLRTIHCPTLIVVGEEDTMTPPALSERCIARLPGPSWSSFPPRASVELRATCRFQFRPHGFLTHQV